MESLVAPLRPYLQPLTHKLPGPLKELSLSLLGPSCHKTLVLDMVPSPACTRLAISKALGVGIIGASSVVKVPQLVKLVSSGSAAGISFPSYALETSAYLISLAYNTRQGFPFSTYGETALIAAQNVAIAALVLHLGGRSGGAAAFAAGLAAAGYALFDREVVGGEMLARLMAGAGVLGVASKVPQIWTVWRAGGTGQLSAFAVFNYLVGSLSRIFTTLQEVPDPLILYGFVAGFALNLVLAAQMVYYWNGPATSGQAKEAGGKARPMAAGETGATWAEVAARTNKTKSASTRRRG